MNLTQRLSTLTLPLLTKELAEQSSRPRTYIVRTAYAAIFFSGTLWAFYQEMGGRWTTGDLDMLGKGIGLFQQVLWTQLAAVYVVLPALMAGVITSEKERDTLGLLLITKLRPLTIVLEKFLSRVLPMLLYLSLSLPLWGVAYSLGGFSAWDILVAAILLVTAVLQVGTIGLMASVYFRTTAQALMATYLCCPFSALCSMGCLSGSLFLDDPSMESSPHNRVAAALVSCLALGFFPAGLGLVAASAALWERAFLQPQNRLLKFLQAVDKFFHELNDNSFTQGIVLIRDELKLPLYAPIAWRETQKRSMGTFRYLTRLLLVVEIPLLFFIVVPLSDNIAWDTGFRVLDLSSYAVWWIAIFAVLSSATGLISGERSRQTLDVLLSTPMSARQIMREKFAGVQRLILVLWVPLGTVIGFHLWWLGQMSYRTPDFDQTLNLLQSIASGIIYLPLIGWLGVHASLRFRSQIAAMTASLVLVLAMAAPNVLFAGYGSERFGDSWLFDRAVSALFPVTGPPPPLSAAPISYAVTATHFLIYTLIWVWLRRRAAIDLVRLAGRCEP